MDPLVFVELALAVAAFCAVVIMYLVYSGERKARRVLEEKLEEQHEVNAQLMVERVALLEENKQLRGSLN